MPFDWKAGVASLVRLAAADQWLVLPAAVVVGTLPGLVAGVSGVGWDNIAVSYAEQWQRACTIHAILCGFYLLDLTFDVVVTGLYNSPFVLYNLMFYFVQGMTAVLCRVYYTDGYVAMLLSSLNDVFVLWFLAVTLLHKCCPAVWTAGQRWAPFLLATIAVFLQSCSLLLRGSFALAVCTAVVLLLGCGGFAVGCVRTAISVEASALNGGLSVDEKRCCLLLVSMVVYYVAVLYAFFGCTAFDADTHAFPAGRSLYIYKYISLGTLVLVSYIPWRVSSRAFVENRRRLDSKLEFISKMSFAIRQRFGILSGGAENFLHELTESLAAGAADMENTMKDVMESCSISKAVLDDFSVCESIINGEARLAAKDTAIFVEVKRTLAKFYADHPYMNLRIFSRESEAAMLGLRVKLEPTVFARVLTILMNAAMVPPKTETVSPPVTVDIKCTTKQDGQRVGHVEETRGGLLGRLGESITPGGGLFVRIELRGANVTRGVFEFFDENGLDKASAFVPAYDKDTGLGFWICREFVRSMGGGIGIVSLEDCDFMDPEVAGLDGNISPVACRTPGGVTPVLRQSTTPPVAAGEEPCCLIIDLPVVQNENSMRFLEASSSFGDEPPMLTVAGLLSRVIGFDRQLRISPFPDQDVNASVNNSVLSGGEDSIASDGLGAMNPVRSKNSDIEESPLGPSPLHSEKVETESAGPAFGPDTSASAGLPENHPDLPTMITDLKILLVDDSKMTRKVLGKMLRSRTQWVQQVTEAEDGVEAVDLVRNSMLEDAPFDVVLLDYLMPGYNGPVSVEKMRAFGFRGMVIGVTGMTSIAMTETFIAHGADRVLLKPIGFNAVYNTVKEIQLERIANLELT